MAARHSAITIGVNIGIMEHNMHANCYSIFGSHRNNGK